jgi:hypothetical protein
MAVIKTCKSSLFSDIGFKPPRGKLFLQLSSMAGWGRKTTQVDQRLADVDAEPGVGVKQREQWLPHPRGIGWVLSLPLPARNIRRRGDILTKKLSTITEHII